MSTPTAAVGAGQDIQQLLDRAAKLLERIDGKLAELVAKINGILSAIPDILVPDWIVEKIQAGIDQMYALFRKLCTKMAEFFNSPGWPPALFAAGDGWLNGVATPSAATEEDVNAKHMSVDDYWKGSAAEGYKNTLSVQQPAFAAMVDLARKIKELLHSAAWGIIKFWAAVVIAVVSLAAGVAGAVAACSTVAGAPVAPAAVIAGILGCLAALAAGAWAVLVEFQGIKDAATALREESQFNTSFDGDKWPRATAQGEWQAD